MNLLTRYLNIHITCSKKFVFNPVRLYNTYDNFRIYHVYCTGRLDSCKVKQDSSL